MRSDALEPAPRRAVEFLLHAAHRHLDMEAAFLAELTPDVQLYRATSREAASFQVFEGGELARVESYCQYVLDSDAPWVVPDTSSDDRARRLAVTAAGSFGAYIGVPVHLSDGRAFGTLCCLSHHARPDLGDRDVAVLEALADVLAFHVEQLEEHTRRIQALEQGRGDLAQQIRRSELRAGLFAEIVGASATPTLVLDPATLVIDFANAAAAWLLGPDRPDDVVGTALWQHRDDWTEAGLRDDLGAVLDGTAPGIRRDYGPTPAWPAVEAVVQLVAPATGGPALLWTAEDVTERRAARHQLERALQREHAASEELRRLDRLRNAFLTAVSHELRTPLMTVLGAVDTVRSGRLDAGLVARFLERASVNAQRLDRLLADLLDLNQFAHGQIRVERERRRLDELVRQAVDEMELETPSPRLELEPVEADVAPVKFERIVVNLVTNAAVHTPPGTAVEVRLTGADDGVLLVVTDQGPGVDPEDRDAVFQPFWQGTTAPPHRPGTGIGLSLVAAFTELHGGRVWVDEAPGGGAAFHVWLPRTAG